MTESLKIAFIGLGQMATALASGFVRANVVNPENIYGFDVAHDSAAKFADTIGASTFDSPAKAIENASVVVFAVKPQHMGGALSPIRDAIANEPGKALFISIAAGLPISYFENALGKSIRLARVMPNTPCLVGEGASGFALNESVKPEDGAIVKTLLETSGLAYELPETLLDAVTGLSGSAPAYVFMAIEALADGGVKAGLPRAIALDLAAQTLKGGAEMYLKTKRHPGALKDSVTSPAGTTIAGVAALEARGFRSALIEAVVVGAERSRELGKNYR